MKVVFNLGFCAEDTDFKEILLKHDADVVVGTFLKGDFSRLVLCLPNPYAFSDIIDYVRDVAELKPKKGWLEGAVLYERLFAGSKSLVLARRIISGIFLELTGVANIPYCVVFLNGNERFGGMIEGVKKESGK